MWQLIGVYTFCKNDNNPRGRNLEILSGRFKQSEPS